MTAKGGAAQRSHACRASFTRFYPGNFDTIIEVANFEKINDTAIFNVKREGSDKLELWTTGPEYTGPLMGGGQVLQFDNFARSREFLKVGGRMFFTASTADRGLDLWVTDGLHGNRGDDRLGGAGADTLDGGAGNDTLIVDNAGDRVVEAVGGGNDVVLAAVDYVLKAGMAVKELRAAIDLIGNELKQVIVGNAGKNILNDGGGAGANALYGFGGNDIFRVATLTGAR